MAYYRALVRSLTFTTTAPVLTAPVTWKINPACCERRHHVTRGASMIRDVPVRLCSDCAYPSLYTQTNLLNKAP